MNELNCQFCGQPFDTPYIMDCCSVTVCGRCVSQDASSLRCPSCKAQFLQRSLEQLRINEFVRCLRSDNKHDTLPTQHSEENLDTEQSLETRFQKGDGSDSSDLQYVTLGKPKSLQQSLESWDSSVKSIPPLPSKRGNKVHKVGLSCQRCMKGVASFICQDCQGLLLCETCENILHGIGLFTKHRVEKYQKTRHSSTDLSETDSAQSINVTNVKKNPATNPNCLLANGKALYSEKAKPHTSGKLGFCLETHKLVCLDCHGDNGNIETDLRKAARVVNDTLGQKQKDLTQQKHRTQRLIYHQQLDVKDIERDSSQLQKELTDKCTEIRILLEEKQKELVRRLEHLRTKRQQQVRRQLEFKENYIGKVSQLFHLADVAQEKLRQALCEETSGDDPALLIEYLNSVDSLFARFSQLTEQGHGTELKNKTVTLNVELPVAQLEEIAQLIKDTIITSTKDLRQSADVIGTRNLKNQTPIQQRKTVQAKLSTGRKGKTNSFTTRVPEKSQSPRKEMQSQYSINNLRKQASSLYSLGQSMDRAIVTPCNIYTSLPQRSNSAFRNIELACHKSSDMTGIMRKEAMEDTNGFVPAKTAPDQDISDEEKSETQRSTDNDKLDQSIITQHFSQESPNKRATDRKKRANTFCTGGRSVSNRRNPSQTGPMKKTQAVPLVNTSVIGQRKNSAQEGGLNVITTPRQSSQLLPASAIITSTSHSQLLNQSSSSQRHSSSSGGVKCMTPVLTNRPKGNHQSKNSVGSLPTSTRSGTPGAFKGLVPNTSVVLLNSTIGTVGNSPSTPMKGGNTSGSTRQSSKQRSNSNLSNILSQSEALLRQQQEVEANPFMKRVFVNTEQTSNAIHLSWLHPRNLKKQKMVEESKEAVTQRELSYILEYGVGVRVNNEQQFRQIYKGPQHKCIITDLNPKTIYRFRVAPVRKNNEKQSQGDWSQIVEVMTRDAIAVETRSMGKHARLANKTIIFERPGLIHATYGYFFGKYSWSVTIKLSTSGVIVNEDCPGLMKVGVAVRQGRAYKLVGVNVNYSLEKSEFTIKLALDCDSRVLKVHTPSGGEVLPLSRHFPYIPAVQNKTPLRGHNYTLRTKIAFDLPYQS